MGYGKDDDDMISFEHVRHSIWHIHLLHVFSGETINIPPAYHTLGKYLTKNLPY